MEYVVAAGWANEYCNERDMAAPAAAALDAADNDEDDIPVVLEPAATATAADTGVGGSGAVVTVELETLPTDVTIDALFTLTAAAAATIEVWGVGAGDVFLLIDEILVVFIGAVDETTADVILRDYKKTTKTTMKNSAQRNWKTAEEEEEAAAEVNLMILL